MLHELLEYQAYDRDQMCEYLIGIAKVLDSPVEIDKAYAAVDQPTFIIECDSDWKATYLTFCVNYTPKADNWLFIDRGLDDDGDCCGQIHEPGRVNNHSYMMNSAVKFVWEKTTGHVPPVPVDHKKILLGRLRASADELLEEGRTGEAVDALEVCLEHCNGEDEEEILSLLLPAVAEQHPKAVGMFLRWLRDQDTAVRKAMYAKLWAWL